MVKGTTRQVIVVKGTEAALFEQAIFLVRDEVIAKGGVTEDALLKEARQLCGSPSFSRWRNLLWSAGGAGLVGAAWVLAAVL